MVRSFSLLTLQCTLLSQSCCLLAHFLGDPRQNPVCRDVFLGQGNRQMSAAQRWREKSSSLTQLWRDKSNQDWYVVRTVEDYRAGIAPPEGPALPDRLATRLIFNHTVIEYALMRKAATKSIQTILKELKCLSTQKVFGGGSRVSNGSNVRRIVFTVVRHPYTKLVSAYQEISRHLRGRKCSASDSLSKPSICRLPFVSMHRRDEPKRFELFVQIFLGSRPSDFAEYQNDGITYHMESTMNRIAKIGTRLNIVIRLESFEQEFKHLMSKFTDTSMVLKASPRILFAMRQDIDYKRYDAWLQDRLKLSALSRRSRELIYSYYRQDFTCFGYEFNASAELQWHQNTPQRDHATYGNAISTIPSSVCT